MKIFLAFIHTVISETKSFINNYYIFSNLKTKKLLTLKFGIKSIVKEDYNLDRIPRLSTNIQRKNIHIGPIQLYAKINGIVTLKTTLYKRCDNEK